MSLQHNLKRVEKGYINDLDNIIKDIVLNHNIYTLSDSVNKVDYNYLHKKYILPFLPNNKILQCSAISLNGNRCSCKSIKETQYLYCKKHIFKKNDIFTPILPSETDLVHYIGDKKTNNTETDTEIDTEINTEIENTDGKIQKIINDKLYYIDSHFMYNFDYTNTLKKCGYINGDDFVLTDDPFLLENIN